MRRKITSKIDATTKIPKKYRKAILPAPPSVKIELTSRCDLKCFFCAPLHKLRKKGDMDFALLERILHELKTDGVKEIGLFYLGESLLYPRLADAIRLAKGLFDYVFLTTNGRLLTEDKVREIISAGLDSLKISFNAANREQYKEAMGVDSFDIVTENIKTARKVRDEIFEMTGHWCGLYASSIQYTNKQPKAMKEILKIIKENVDEHYWLPLYNYKDRTETNRGNRGRIGRLRDILPCWQLFREAHITWTGILAGCCFSENVWDLGDLNKMSFMEAWNSPNAQKLREAHLRRNVKGTVCERCVK